MELTDLGYKGKKLEKLGSDGIGSVPELLYKQPRKYLHFNKVLTLALSEEVILASKLKTPVVFKGKVLSAVLDKVKDSNISVTKMKLINESNGCKLYVNIFGSYREFDTYEQMTDKEIFVGGVVTHNVLNGYDLLSMSNPDLITVSEEDLKIYPVYRKYKGISEEYYKDSIKTAYDQLNDDYMPRKIINTFHLMSLSETVKGIHYPASKDEIEKAKKRIVFDNMLYFASKVENNNVHDTTSAIKPIKSSLLDTFINSLPYSLTDDQRNAVSLLKEKMLSGQTSALVQGDVSCGKTVVAMALMILMAENKYQSVLMAPTVILAKQHYEELTGYGKTLGFSVALLTSDITTAQKNKVIKEIADGKHLLIVGTHSCFGKNVEYKNLGLVVTDEEHKFGVMQRESIRSKTDNGIHTVTMSATPIPRTIACSLYGNNIEVITIKQMPNGRKPIQTAICTSDKPVFSFTSKELEKGNQVYVVCPLIDEAEEDSKMSGISSIEEVAKKYKAAYEPLGYKVGVITGKTPSEEQAEIKKLFTENQIQILIATTVIEVGINVPNATLITITSAERFGLATLHQLRGRVGRGTKQSYCILQKSSEEISSTNLEILQGETNGFEIAKADLSNRGTGNILGTEQSGNNRFIELIIEYPNLYECVKKIAHALTKEERATYINTFEERYPSCS